MKKGEKTKIGFTIIEVSLVLAIAGLIFLMIFIALPALQRQQRNTAREEDMMGLVSAIKKFQSNNRGALPTGTGEFTIKDSNPVATKWNGFLQDYLNSDSFVDPSGEDYVLKVSACSNSGGGSVGSPCAADNEAVSSTFPNDYSVYVVIQATCSGSEDTGAVLTSNPRKLAIMYRLESGGLYCINT